ncbi:glycosyltransferase family 2 protein [Solirubrobacter soli]|uniref:glycosyltransferase family 2 protein n=1 Tax=Solirubrobacter soli TaxID=363832 RepID=UPI00146DBC92|nr:glycosyltransferase family 2 protein [Solirubrobacter soli]
MPTPHAQLRLPGVSVVLPAFNEAPNIARAIHAARRAASANAADHQIVVVDDGSTDGTRQIVTDLARSIPTIRLVEHERNRGYGAAVNSGIRATTQPWVLLTDADLQFDLDELSSFVALADEADVIVGRRVQRRDPLYRRLNAAGWNRLVRAAFGVDVRDIDCAFKLVNRDLLVRMPLRSTGALISTELLVRAVAGGASVRELEVTHRPRIAGRSSGANPLVIVRAFRELSQLRRELATSTATPAPRQRVGHPVA